jgi:hypothetical protein
MREILDVPARHGLFFIAGGHPRISFFVSPSFFGRLPIHKSPWFLPRNACFNLTKRLILESMRFFECVANTESLRVKSEVVDHDAWDEDLAPWEVKHGIKREKTVCY